MQCKQQVTAQGQQSGPDPGVDAPLAPVGAVELVAALAVEADSCGLDIAETTVLDADVAVAAQRDTVSLDADDAVEDVVPGCNLC